MGVGRLAAPDEARLPGNVAQMFFVAVAVVRASVWDNVRAQREGNASELCESAEFRGISRRAAVVRPPHILSKCGVSACGTKAIMNLAARAGAQKDPSQTRAFPPF
jgi:hypothetical protein